MLEKSHQKLVTVKLNIFEAVLGSVSHESINSTYKGHGRAQKQEEKLIFSRNKKSTKIEQMSKLELREIRKEKGRK